MTDNEIIQALECSAEWIKQHGGNTSTGIAVICRQALGHIKRLQAENERLKNENKILSINADTAFQDGLNEAQDLYAEQVKAEIKSKAIKEFAERLKKPNRWREEDIYYIDTLIKEMVGE